MTTISSHLLFLAAALFVAGMLLVVSAENEIFESREIKSANGGEILNDDREKRPFFVGSRYGRSQSDLSNMDQKSSMTRIVPRNDRFFFGSRYGKRSAPVAAADEENNQLTCFYTGVTNLFRCVENLDEQK